jgi:hypothetical protein
LYPLPYRQSIRIYLPVRINYELKGDPEQLAIIPEGIPSPYDNLHARSPPYRLMAFIKLYDKAG